MIRRKLTRIEVTLDDTKELDDYFTKSGSGVSVTNISLQNATSKQLQSVHAIVANHIAQHISETPNLSASVANLNESSQERLSYNPQPTSQSNRFQLDQDPNPQLR
jgi:hypothetical protein